jgi:SOS-response transcriptional repressor LexA
MPLPNIDPVHLSRIQDHYARHRSLPSYAGLGQVVGFRAKTAAVKLAQRLTAAGYLRPAPGGKLAPTERFFELPLVQTPVRAGAAEHIDAQFHAELVTLDSYLVEVPSQTVFVRVSGDSMRDAGVFEGDLAVVERANTAEPGQFVVAMVDDAFTIKELRFEGKQPVLIPHNPEFPPIHPAGKLEIFGVVRGIVRRYHPMAVNRPRPRSGAKP